jgi:hypothetical protein
LNGFAQIGGGELVLRVVAGDGYDNRAGNGRFTGEMGFAGSGEQLRLRRGERGSESQGSKEQYVGWMKARHFFSLWRRYLNGLI